METLASNMDRHLTLLKAIDDWRSTVAGPPTLQLSAAPMPSPDSPKLSSHAKADPHLLTSPESTSRQPSLLPSQKAHPSEGTTVHSFLVKSCTTCADYYHARLAVHHMLHRMHTVYIHRRCHNTAQLRLPCAAASLVPLFLLAYHPQRPKKPGTCSVHSLPCLEGLFAPSAAPQVSSPYCFHHMTVVKPPEACYCLLPGKTNILADALSSVLCLKQNSMATTSSSTPGAAIPT